MKCLIYHDGKIPADFEHYLESLSVDEVIVRKPLPLKVKTFHDKSLIAGRSKADLYLQLILLHRPEVIICLVKDRVSEVIKQIYPQALVWDTR